MGDASAEQMSVTFAFKLKPSTDGKTPLLVMSSRSVTMENLDLCVSDSNIALLINALCWLFADKLKTDACTKIAKHLDEHMGTCVDGLNMVLSKCTPLLDKMGWTLPVEQGNFALTQEALVSLVPETPVMRAVIVETRGLLPEELDWAD